MNTVFQYLRMTLNQFYHATYVKKLTHIEAHHQSQHKGQSKVDIHILTY